jgi:hypothetical protein
MIKDPIFKKKLGRNPNIAKNGANLSKDLRRLP